MAKKRTYMVHLIIWTFNLSKLYEITPVTAPTILKSSAAKKGGYSGLVETRITFSFPFSILFTRFSPSFMLTAILPLSTVSVFRAITISTSSGGHIAKKQCIIHY